MSTLEEKLLNNYKKNKEESLHLVPKWKEGDTVKVLKNMEINVTNVKDFLGEKCIVDKINIHVATFGSGARVEYMLKLGDRLEPFWEEELDQRYKSKIK